MKKALFILIIATMVYACKKSDQPQPTIQNNTQTSVTQDSRLLGTWVQDSSKADGGGLGIGSTIYDSIHITNAYFKTYTITAAWQTTAADSLFLTWQGSPSSHYKYSFTNNILLLYLHNTNSTTNIKYWYHKF